MQDFSFIEKVNDMNLGEICYDLKYNVMSKIIFSTFNESEPEVECEQSTIDVAEIWYYLKNIVNVQNNIQYVQWKP